MHVSEIHLEGMKRFKALTINALPPTARLVVMVGQNGSGKSSLFDGFRLWQGLHAGIGHVSDERYLRKGEKTTTGQTDWAAFARVKFHEPVPQTQEDFQRVFYFRSAYRNESDFTVLQLKRTGSIFDGPRIGKLIDADVRVSDNYARIVSASVDDLYSGRFDEHTAKQLRESFTDDIRTSMKAVFDDLNFKGLGDPLRNGSFYFDKGVSRDFHYMNLSAGEKSAFDLLLDFTIKRKEYNDTVFCIDEPEAHMHTRLQGRLLRELFKLTPLKSQLWIATHAVGMLRTARDLSRERPGEITFLNFHDLNFDEPIVIVPSPADRSLWIKMLAVAMDDLATLVAPRQVVLCEGRPKTGKSDVKAEFDAKCYRKIFASEFSDTDFISVGNSAQVQEDSIQLGNSMQTLVAGTSVLRLVDRDDRGAQEIIDLQRTGVRVLRRRHLEAYLMDDQILSHYCASLGKGELAADVLAAKAVALAESVARGNAIDDVKSASGEVYNGMRRILGLSGMGNTAHVFMRDVLANLLIPGTMAYNDLKEDVFGTCAI